MGEGSSLPRSRHDTVHDAPATAAPPVRRRRWQLLALLLAVVAGGGAVVLYMRLSGGSGDRSEGNSGPVAMAPANVGSANAGSANAGAVASDAAAANGDAASDAAAPGVTAPGAAIQTSMSQDAAQRDDARREEGRRASGAASGTAPSDARPASTGKPRAAQRPSGPPGFITIDSQPWATIYVDGKDYGPTPVGNVALPPGRHGVRAVTPSGTTKDFSIWIESGKTSPPKRVEW
jgi:hypothetical protein